MDLEAVRAAFAHPAIKQLAEEGADSRTLAQAMVTLTLTGRPFVALPGGARGEDPGVQEQTGSSAGPSHTTGTTTGTTTAPAQTPSPVPVLGQGLLRDRYWRAARGFEEQGTGLALLRASSGLQLDGPDAPVVPVGKWLQDIAAGSALPPGDGVLAYLVRHGWRPQTTEPNFAAHLAQLQRLTTPAPEAHGNHLEELARTRGQLLRSRLTAATITPPGPEQMSTYAGDRIRQALDLGVPHHDLATLLTTTTDAIHAYDNDNDLTPDTATTTHLLHPATLEALDTLEHRTLLHAIPGPPPTPPTHTEQELLTRYHHLPTPLSYLVQRVLWDENPHTDQNPDTHTNPGTGTGTGMRGDAVRESLWRIQPSLDREPDGTLTEHGITQFHHAAKTTFRNEIRKLTDAGIITEGIPDQRLTELTEQDLTNIPELHTYAQKENHNTTNDHQGILVETATAKLKRRGEVFLEIRLYADEKTDGSSGDRFGYLQRFSMVRRAVEFLDSRGVAVPSRLDLYLPRYVDQVRVSLDPADPALPLQVHRTPLLDSQHFYVPGVGIVIGPDLTGQSSHAGTPEAPEAVWQTMRDSMNALVLTLVARWAIGEADPATTAALIGTEFNENSGTLAGMVSAAAAHRPEHFASEYLVTTLLNAKYGEAGRDLEYLNANLGGFTPTQAPDIVAGIPLRAEPTDEEWQQLEHLTGTNSPHPHGKPLDPHHVRTVFNVLRQYTKIQRLDLIAAAMRHEGIQRYAIMPPHLAHTLQRLTMDEGLPSPTAALMKSPRNAQGHLNNKYVQDWIKEAAGDEDRAITQIRRDTGISLNGVSVEEIARNLQLRDKHRDIDRYFKMNHAEGVSDISDDSPRGMRVKERRSVGNDPAVTVSFYHDQPMPVQNEWLSSYFDTAIDSVVSAVEAFQSAGVTIQKELHVHLFRYNSKFYIFRNESAGIDVEQHEERESDEKTLAEAFPFADSIVIYPHMMDILTTTAVIEPEPERGFPTNVRRPHFAVLLHEMAHVVSVGHSGLERTASTFAPGVEGVLALFGPYGRTNTQEALAEFMTALLLGADEPGGRFHTHAASAHREKAHELYRALGG
ncbi:hypothetical protein, partial [Streptomyces sp. NPDC086010]|uniref:hypothetical protein n=1 Tax=Streptomyces sp. NPDC086010 TaxID=3365745 RepID=UPI0037D72758